MRKPRVTSAARLSVGNLCRPVSVAWLVLLALATLQLAVAQHASAHTTLDLGEACQFCVHLDDCGNALKGVPPGAIPSLASADRRIEAGHTEFARRPVARRSRAPPTS